MVTRMTAAWGANVTNLLLFLSGFLVALCVLAVGVTFFTSRTLLASLDPAFTLLIGFWLLVGTAFRFHGGRVSGRFLLDCGPSPTRNLFFLLAVFNLISGSWAAVVRGMSFDILGEFLLVAVFLFFASERFQIRENGIWQYGNLLRWHKIISYSWTDHGTLMLHTKGRLILLPSDLPVLLEHEEAVTALLIEHAPQARES